MQYIAPPSLLALLLINVTLELPSNVMWDKDPQYTVPPYLASLLLNFTLELSSKLM